jgi:hypothetical protein
LTAHPDAATWRKVGVREGDRLVLLGAPAHWSSDAIPALVTVAQRRSRGTADVLVAFFTTRAALRRAAGELAAAITTDGMAWVAWPRTTAGHVSDLSDVVVRDTMLVLGLVDVKVAMLDEDWSGLKFVWRREHRAGR